MPRNVVFDENFETEASTKIGKTVVKKGQSNNNTIEEANEVVKSKNEQEMNVMNSDRVVQKPPKTMDWMISVH